MNRQQRLEIIEKQCEKCYSIINGCHRTINRTTVELDKLIKQFLKLKAQLEAKPIKTTKLMKLRAQMKSLGISDADIDSMLNK